MVVPEEMPPFADDGVFFNLAAVGAAQADCVTRRFLRANHRFREMVGYSEEELRGLTFLDLTLPEDRERNLRLFDAALSEGQNEFAIEKRLRRKDGTTLWVNVTAALVRDGAGRARYSIAVIQDITDRKRAEEALRESERQLKLVLETAPVSILYLDRDLRVRFANRIYLQRLRKAADAVIGRPLRDVIGEENFSSIAAHLARALEGFEIENDVRFKYAVLGWRDLHVRYSPERDAHGAVRGIVAAIEDITERKAAEAALRASEHRFAAIFAGAAAGLCEISLEGRFERVNDELCRMLGRSRETLLGRNVLEVTHPDDVVGTLRGVAELLQTKTCASLEKRYVRPEGDVLWVSSMLTRLDDQRGTPRAVLAVSIDLTARRAAERALAESEAKFRTLAEASPAIIWLTGPSGETRYINRRYLEFAGKTAPEALTASLPPLHPDDQAGFADQLSVAVRERQLFWSRARWRRHDGTWRWIESQALPHVSHEGGYLGHVGHSLDITDLVETTEALRHSEDRLRRATEIETVGVAFFDLSGRITQTNAAFLRMSGYTSDDVARGILNLDTLTAPEHRTTVHRARDELVALGRTLPFEKQAIRKDGTRWWGLFAATRLSPDEGVEFVIDISERKRSEEELRGYRAELEARVLHRTAELDAANGALRDEILERARAEQARRDLFRQLASAQEDERRRISRELHDQVGQDLTGLMLGLKALERHRGALPSGELRRLQALTESIGKQIHDMALEIRPTALDDLGLLQTLSNYLDDWSKRTGIEVDFHSSGCQGERLPSHIETTLYRIVREALNNVVKHAHARRVSLIIERQADQAVAIVEDNGHGFDPEAIRPASGTRLGIVGMRERAMLAGGELSIESTPGCGTTVFVRVPLQTSS